MVARFNRWEGVNVKYWLLIFGLMTNVLCGMDNLSFEEEKIECLLSQKNDLLQAWRSEFNKRFKLELRPIDDVTIEAKSKCSDPLVIQDDEFSDDDLRKLAESEESKTLKTLFISNGENLCGKELIHFMEKRPFVVITINYEVSSAVRLQVLVNKKKELFLELVKFEDDICKQKFYKVGIMNTTLKKIET